jgi:hypothetical protein
MNRKTIGLIVLISGVLLMCGGLMTVVSGFMGMMAALEPVAALKSPGEVEVQITEPGTYSLWYDQTYRDGPHTEEYGSYRGGFTFQMESTTPGGGINPTFNPLGPGRSQTLSTGSRESSGLGSFEINTSGTYTLHASNPNPEAETYRFSLTQGSFLAHVGGFFGRTFLFGILAFLGFALTIGGVLMMVLRRKKTSPPSLTTA